MFVVITAATVMFFRHLGLSGITSITITTHIGITVAMVMLLRGFGPYGIPFMTMLI
jgi:hypothetical protein